MPNPKKMLNNLNKTAFWGRYSKDKRGFVLVLTLMLISLMSILAITSFELVTSTTRITENHKLYLRSLYIADSGIEETLCVLSKANWGSISWADPSTLSTLALNTYDASWIWDAVGNKWTISKSDLGSTYSVEVTMNATNQTMAVESLGTVSGFSKTIVAEITNSPSVKITIWMEKEM